MNLDVRDESIEITNIKGRMKGSRLSTDKLPDVILTERPVELQFVTFGKNGNGHRYSLGHNWQLEFDFHIDTAATSILNKTHSHDYWEIIIADTGLLEMQIESASYELNRGDICVLNRAARHAEYFNPDQRVIYLTLSLEYITSWSKDTNIAFRKPISHLFANGINLPHYQNKDYIIARPKSEDAYPSALNLIQTIKEEFLQNMPGSKYLVRGLVYRLISLFTVSGSYNVHYYDMRAEDKFSLANSAKQILDKNKCRTTLFELEKKLQYSGAYINRLFTEKYCCSITEYNQNVCLQHMAKLLITTNNTVEEICHIIGFTNKTHLYRLFKEKYGCTPSDFRANR